ncbi:MAG: lipoate--protein ligase family protein [Actinomycetota bacterium]
MRSKPAKTPNSWTLLSAQQLGAAGNMAADQAMLAFGARTGPPEPLVRFYAWGSTTVSIGRNQRLAPSAQRACADEGVEVVRRPTGGTAVVHGGDLTYCVAGPSHGAGVLEIYCRVAEGLIAGFARLGLPVSVAERSGPLRASAACFASAIGADLVVGERKLCGSAQVRRQGWYLQHGSIPLTDVRSITGRLLDVDIEGSVHLGALVPGITFDILQEALTGGFCSVWGKAVTRPLSQVQDQVRVGWAHPC